MRLLYIFPHPDDESFGPAAGMHSQLKNGHQVYLLTLTKGGATQQRHKLGLSVAEMGEVRYKEMLAVEKVLGLTGMTVLDFPDSGLKELDPRVLEREVEKHIQLVKPDVVVTLPVHGISGFHDHLVAHAVVKRVYLEARDAAAGGTTGAAGAAMAAGRAGNPGTAAGSPRRLAFVTLPDSGKPTWTEDGSARLKLTEEVLIDCVIQLGPDDVETMKKALSCYATYKDTIEKSGVVEKIGDKLYFELFGEDFTPPLRELTERM